MKPVCELSSPFLHSAPKGYFEEYKISPFKWKKKKIRWFFEQTPELLRMPITPYEIWQDIRITTRQWVGYSSIRIVETSKPDDADIIIKFSDTPPQRTTGWTEWKVGTVAVGHFPFSEIDRIAGDIWINSRDFVFASWFGRKLRGEPFKGVWYDFASMIGHELGHTIGIGHSENNAAIMAPFYKLVKPYRLHTDDIMAARAVYGMNMSWSDKLKMRLGFI